MSWWKALGVAVLAGIAFGLASWGWASLIGDHDPLDYWDLGFAYAAGIFWGWVILARHSAQTAASLQRELDSIRQQRRDVLKLALSRMDVADPDEWIR